MAALTEEGDGSRPDSGGPAEMSNRGPSALGCFLIVLSLAGGAPPWEVGAQAGTVWTVPGDAPTIRDAVAAASSGDEIVLVDALYTGPDNRNISFHGKAITVRSASGEPAQCLIDCENAGDGFIFTSGEGADSILRGVTIARAGDGASKITGAGVVCNGAGPTIEDCILRECFGSGMVILSGSPDVTDTKFQNNVTSSFGLGAGVRNGTGSPTFTGCRFTANDSSSTGGGFYNSSGTPTLTECVFIGNSAFFGGGLYSAGGDLQVILCSFSGNFAKGFFGGGMFLGAGAALVEECDFTGNGALTSGGGMHISGGAPTVRGCLFTGNGPIFGDVTPRGGGMSVSGAGALIEDCQFILNEAGTGAGLYAASGSARIVDCLFEVNIARLLGGGIGVEGGRPRIEGCVFLGNEGPGAGLGVSKAAATVIGSRFEWNVGGGAHFLFSEGAMINCILRMNEAENGAGAQCGGGEVGFVNCLFEKNTGERGGAVFSFAGATTTLTNCTIVDNEATVRGGGLFVGAGATVEIANGIFWGNADGAAPGQDEDAQIARDSAAWGSIRRSLVEGWTGAMGGAGNTGEAPRFVDGAGGDFRLADGSPAIDAGDNTAVPEDEFDIDGDMDVSERTPRDLAGGARFVDAVRVEDTGVSDGVNPIVDMGAYEAPETALGACPTDVTGDGTVNAADLALLLSTWGPGPPTRASDFNSDGMIDAADLALLLSFWGECGGGGR